jgi:hypothetical protein
MRRFTAIVAVRRHRSPALSHLQFQLLKHAAERSSAAAWKTAQAFSERKDKRL